jgi:hypothetical protein
MESGVIVMVFSAFISGTNLKNNALQVGQYAYGLGVVPSILSGGVISKPLQLSQHSLIALL